MNRIKIKLISAGLLVFTLSSPVVLYAHNGDGHSEGVQTGDACEQTAPYCSLALSGELAKYLENIPTPPVTGPAQPPSIVQTTPSGQLPAVKRKVTYSVITRGNITANLEEFKSQANATLNDPRSWRRLGVQFNEVSSGGDFTLALSEATQVPGFNPAVCSADYSCQVGNYVIINQDRWLGATPPWNSAGGSLRDYRHMVVNHETGHWLGHGHRNCGGAGQPAPVMQQQSIGLQGCNFNPWPLDSELWSSRLGL